LPVCSVVLLSLLVAEIVLESVWLVSVPVCVVVFASAVVLVDWPVMRLPV
jgi:hypothetical protein